VADKYPREFGRYTLLAPLAQGGMGALYLACVGEQGLERLCVIKTVLPHLADPEYVARFRDEAKVVVRLSHGNLVPVFDAGMVDGELYLAMEYVEGKDLRAVWNRCAKKGIAFPIDVAVHIIRELSRGLNYAHNFGGIKLVHRDVSPPNVLIAFSGEIKLTDFGLASSTLKVEKTAAGIIYGKVSYMSPEQARGEPIDGRTDIYAAGIILWELLTGRQLFPQNNQTDGGELIERVRNPTIDPPSLRAPRVPPMLDQIVLRGLAKDQNIRYSTGEQFRADLTAFLATNKDYVATDAARVATFMQELFDDDIVRERDARRELLERVSDRLAENQRQEQAERGAAIEKQQRKAEILAAIERKSHEDIKQVDGKLNEDELPEAVREQLAAHDTGKMLGSIIERWRVLRKIGEGGMGRVFEAEHQEIGRRVAIKVLHPVYSRTPEVVARFRMEARAASRIGHPNIIEVTDSGTTIDGSFYFVMELLEGVDVADRLKKDGRLPIEEALQITHQVAQALAAAHQVNIVHRDLKPENIFLISRDGNPHFVKVLDFGIAKSLEEDKIKLTTPGMAMGTPEYMAPEQAAGKDSDPRSDIYSLGAILYEMIGGRAPIAGENLMEILMRKATEDPANLSTLRPDVPARVARLCMRALSRSPDARPKSMNDMATEIAACLADIKAGIADPVPPTSGSTSQEGVAAVGGSATDRRRKLLGWVAVSGGIVGVLGGLFWALTPPRPLPARPDLAVQAAVPPPNTVNPPKNNPPNTPPGPSVVVPPVVPPVEPPPPPLVPPTRPNPPSTKEKLLTLNMPPPIERAAALSLIEEANLYRNSNKSEVAFDKCYHAAGNSQVRGKALTCMGEAEFTRGRTGEAIKWGKRALKEKGLPAKDVYLLLGQAYLKNKNCNEARIYFLKVINGSDSNNPEALKGLEYCNK
jgi:serine/threonine protein kinase